MDCPRCTKPNPDDRKYCGECGAPLVPGLVYLEGVIEKRVEEIIGKKLKEQKFVEIEITESIASRLWHWAKIGAWALGLPLGVLFVILGIIGLSKFSDFSGKVEQAEASVKKSADTALGKAADATSQASRAQDEIEKARQQASRSFSTIQSEVERTSKKISTFEQRVGSQADVANQKMEDRVRKLSERLDEASREIETQQRRLASSDELLKTLFSSGKVITFDTKTQSSKFLAVSGAGKVLVFILLEHPPIFQTILIQYHIYLQPRNSYGMMGGNVLFFLWGESIESLQRHPLVVSYVPDPTNKERSFKSLSLKDGKPYADEQLLVDLPK